MVIHGQSGYVGSSMSVRAEEAYANGERPISKWTKKGILDAAKNKGASEEALASMKAMPIAQLRELALAETSWHHTSKMLNETRFYSIKEAADLENIEKEAEAKKSHIKEIDAGYRSQGKAIAEAWLKGNVATLFRTIEGEAGFYVYDKERKYLKLYRKDGGLAEEYGGLVAEEFVKAVEAMKGAH